MKNHKMASSNNIKMLQFVATKLGALCDEVVFLGGCTTALFMTESIVSDVRYTFDVDCIVDVISLGQYYQLEKKLTQQGFRRSLTEEVICRWFYEDAILDVMPTDEEILGFGNRWYKKAIEYAWLYPITDDINIKLVTAPYFIATKLEAFRTRGKMDFYASHDFEDIVSILDGRMEIIDEIARADEALKKYLIKTFAEMQESRSFRGALPGHFSQYGSLAETHAALVEEKIKTIIAR
ncbi:MAG: hypothetical protein ACHQAX_03645 [Gammaproteobacteria bacterium]